MLETLAPRLPLLITGITGVAGYNAFLHFRDIFPGRVIGVRPPKTWRLQAPDVVGLDLADPRAVERLFAQHRFGSVLATGGNCALKSCELDPAMAQQVNVTGPVAVARCAHRFGARLVHLSADMVYSGKSLGGYVETDAVDPVTVYGKTLAEAETAILHHCPEAAILRIALPMGRSFNHCAGAIDWIDYRFRNGWHATLYYDEVRSSTYTDDLNEVFACFLWGTPSGLFHCGGPRPLTLYQIGQIVNRVGGYDPALLKGCVRFEADPIPPRAGNVTMNSRKLLTALGRQPFQPWPFTEELCPIGLDWHRIRPAGEVRGPQALERFLFHYAAEEGRQAKEAYLTSLANHPRPPRKPAAEGRLFVAP